MEQESDTIHFSMLHRIGQCVQSCWTKSSMEFLGLSRLQPIIQLTPITEKVAWTNLPCTLSYDSQDRVMRPSRNSLSFHGVTPISRISASYSFHLFAPHT